ncbi:hypothetical protein B0H16DRAFT_1396849 [Mycena metata]|uniref:F-box domain-containing protein n=1 Tax=Mycena metata TaxID=1033252 RepID=A0AAD7GJE2_9AGAR|nr:hypothetical protein B0H16DRAFT_1396849 [Mycena metata]
MSGAAGTLAWRQSQRDHLAEICETISQLDPEFQSEVPEFLDADRRKLLAIVSSFSYDVTMVPFEIISRIFVECLPADGRVRPSPHRAPLLFAQICRRWREIALGTGQLWRSFDFTLQSAPASHRAPHREPSHAGICALHRAWCQRSNGYPLSLTLRCADGRFNLPVDFLDTIAMFAPQWERMELAFPDWLDNARSIALFAERIGGPFPALSTLALTVGSSRYMEETLGMFQNLPQLRHFRLFSGLAPSRVPIGAAPLTSLELQTEVSLNDCNAIFQRFPNLQHLGLLYIDFDLPAAPVPSPRPPLQSLSLGPGGSDFLALLAFPHLRRLNYSIYDSDDIDILLAFIGRSACSLTHLTLRVHALTEDVFLLQCLQVLPFLEDLRINYWQAGSRRLCNHLQSLDIVPHLHTLSFWEPATHQYAYLPLVQMLQTRRSVRTPGGVPYLLSFYLGFASSLVILPYGPDAEKLGRLVEGGLRLRIHSPRFEWPEGQYIEEQLDFPHPHPTLQVGAA